MLADAASAWLAATAAANGDDGSGVAWLLILGPIAVVATYLGLWSYYRNTHQSHAFERETRIESQPVVAHDAKVSKVTGVTRSRIERENRTNHRDRVQRFG